MNSTSFNIAWTAVNSINNYKVFEDNILVGSTINTYYTLTGLYPDTQHTAAVSAVNNQGESPQSTSLSVTIADPIIGQSLPTPIPGWQRIDNTDPNFMYTTQNAWSTYTNSNYYNNSYKYLNSSSDKILFTFYGTELRIIGTLASNNGTSISISIDGTNHSFTQYGSTVYQALNYQITNLSLGNHTVIISNESGNYFGLDAIDIDQSGYLLPQGIPPAPSTLTSYSVTNISFSLNWVGINGINNYKVYKNGILLGSTTSTSYGLSGLYPDTQYSLTVSSVDAQGESPQSTPLLITTSDPIIGQALPIPIPGWQRIDNTDPNIMYTTQDVWGNYTNSNYYNNYYEYVNSTSDQIILTFYGTELRLIGTTNTSNGSNITVNVDGTNHSFSQYAGTVYQALNYQITNLSLGNHTVVISNKSGGYFGLDAVDIDQSGYLIPQGIPLAPSSLASSAITCSSSNVGWGIVAENPEYKVYQDGTLLGSTSLTSYGLTGLTASTQYSITVSAFNIYGESPQSTPLLIETLDQPQMTNISDWSQVTPTSVKIDWAYYVGATAYNIYENNLLLGTTTGLSFIANNLDTNVPYSLTITATISAGETLPSLPTLVETSSGENSLGGGHRMVRHQILQI